MERGARAFLLRLVASAVAIFGFFGAFMFWSTIAHEVILQDIALILLIVTPRIRPQLSPAQTAWRFAAVASAGCLIGYQYSVIGARYLTEATDVTILHLLPVLVAIVLSVEILWPAFVRGQGASGESAS